MCRCAERLRAPGCKPPRGESCCPGFVRPGTEALDRRKRKQQTASGKPADNCAAGSLAVDSPRTLRLTSHWNQQSGRIHDHHSRQESRGIERRGHAVTHTAAEKPVELINHRDDGSYAHREEQRGPEG